MPTPIAPPEQINVNGLDDYLAVIARIVFQSGMGRPVVNAKWDDIVEAFGGFDINEVADFNPADVDRLCQDSRVIRNRRKIEAIVSNANRILDLESDHGFGAWLKSHPDEPSRNKAIQKEFAFLGPTGVHEFCWIVGEPTAEGCPA